MRLRCDRASSQQRIRLKQFAVVALLGSFQGVKDTIAVHGLFCALYTDRGTHYWHTPEAGGKVDKKNLTQFGRAMHQLGIEMIAAYSPEAREALSALSRLYPAYHNAAGKLDTPPSMLKNAPTVMTLSEQVLGATEKTVNALLKPAAP